MDFKAKYFDLWKIAWNFHKGWCNNGGTDKEWEQLIEESTSIMNEHKGTPEYQFMEELMLAVIGELERKSR